MIPKARKMKSPEAELNCGPAPIFEQINQEKRKKRHFRARNPFLSSSGRSEVRREIDAKQHDI